MDLCISYHLSNLHALFLANTESTGQVQEHLNHPLQLSTFSAPFLACTVKLSLIRANTKRPGKITQQLLKEIPQRDNVFLKPIFNAIL